MATILPFSKDKTKLVGEASGQDADISLLGRKNRERALALVVAKYRKPLFRHAVHMLANAEDAYEITQEVFIRAHREAHLYDEGFHIRGWLYRVTTNLCLKRLRSRKVRALFALRKPEGEPESEVLVPVAAAIQEELRKEVAAALQELPDRFKSMVILRYYDDLSYKEIAEILDVPIGSVMSGLSRAKEKLSGLLKEHLQEEMFSE